MRERGGVETRKVHYILQLHAGTRGTPQHYHTTYYLRLFLFLAPKKRSMPYQKSKITKIEMSHTFVLFFVVPHKNNVVDQKLSTSSFFKKKNNSQKNNNIQLLKCRCSATPSAVIVTTVFVGTTMKAQ
jgi:hypothetical protein